MQESLVRGKIPDMKRLPTFILLLFLLASSRLQAHAQTINLCTQAGPLQTQCEACVGTGDTPTAMWTAIGCIPVDNAGLATGLVSFLLAIAGGISVLFILFGSFTVATSASDPQKLQTGQSIITAAIVGLLFILLSVIFLQLIGVTILQIPGLT